MIKQQAYTLSRSLQVLPVAPNQTGRIVCNTFGLLFCPFSFAIGLSDSELLPGCRHHRRSAFFFCICSFCAPRLSLKTRRKTEVRIILVWHGSDKEYLYFISERLSGLDAISYRPMMGEYIIYYRGKIVGGIYDNRLLVKKTKSALELMPAAACAFPYDGAKEMLLVDEVDNKEFLTKLFEAMYDELPLPKQKR